MYKHVENWKGIENVEVKLENANNSCKKSDWSCVEDGRR